MARQFAPGLFIIFGLVLAGVLTPAPASGHGGNSDPNVVHACVHNVTKIVRVVGVGGTCVTAPMTHAETAAHWTIVGPSGPQGATGPAGPQGSSGAAGETGATGSQGPAGPQGETGAAGATGATGSQGLAGQQGETGAPGATGATGSQGPAGQQGETGPVGATGATGPQGPAGEQGTVGPVGPVGPPGENGVSIQGPVGLAGSQGPVGPVGPVGPSDVYIGKQNSGPFLLNGTHFGVWTTVAMVTVPPGSYLIQAAATGINPTSLPVDVHCAIFINRNPFSIAYTFVLKLAPAGSPGDKVAMPLLSAIGSSDARLNGGPGMAELMCGNTAAQIWNPTITAMRTGSVTVIDQSLIVNQN
jgi:hypothetical protein